MAIALQTTLAEDVGAEFQPGGEFRLQVDSAEPVAGLTIDVEAAVDATAEFVLLHSWRAWSGPIKRFAEQYRVRIRVRGNTAGNSVTVRRSE
ncbi:MAG: hypothetical protein DI537_20515 [Stutzerimonas stutzeri]|nr:MAG: hypothetical protein DI537_20515 [Stutzerimonas stutzeri]